MANPTRAQLIKLGISSVVTGDLRRLREKVGLSRNAQAHLMEVTPDALKRWEDAEQGMNSQSAARVGEWYWAAQRVVEEIEREGIKFEDLVPLSTASQYLAMSADEVLEKCRTGSLQCEDLGVLGQYIYRSHIPRLDPAAEEGA